MSDESMARAERQRQMDRATRFFGSTRGQYIVGQALRIAEEALRARGDVSNADDAQLLGDILFPMGYALERDREAIIEQARQVGQVG